MSSTSSAASTSSNDINHPVASANENMDNNTHNGGSIRRSKRKASSEALKEIRKITRPARASPASSNGAIQEGESLLNLVLRFCPIFDPSNLCDTRHTIEALFGSVNDLYEVLCTKNTSMTHQIPIELAKAKLIYIALQKMDDEITGLVKARISGLINSITMPSTLSLFHRAVTLFILLQSPWTMEDLGNESELLIVKLCRVLLDITGHFQTKILEWFHVSWQDCFPPALMELTSGQDEAGPATGPQRGKGGRRWRASTRGQRQARGKYHNATKEEAIKIFRSQLEASENKTKDDESQLAPFAQYLAKFQAGLTHLVRNIPRDSSGRAQLPLKASAIEDVVRCIDLLYQHNLAYKLVPSALFYNDQVCEAIDYQFEFSYYKANEPYSLLNYPFLLNLTAKFDAIRYESAVQMRNELHDTFFRVMFEGVRCPYLVLEVRRDHLVRDTLYQLDIKSSMDLRKQLKVRFVGEEGVDEGGVQKEFFQLLIREIFDPKYGMFTKNEESGLYWFTLHAAVDQAMLDELRLMGQLIGLAVYNTVILDIHFPICMYKKLLHESVTFEDVADLDPSLYRSLNQILNHMTKEEIEACERTFEVDVDVFGTPTSVELVEGGSKVALTYSNRREFVERYVDYLFNKSCAKQLEAFQQGFDRICCDSIIKMFRPEELDLLICGSPDLDFDALESSATYDGGYTMETPIIRYFWETVREFSDEQKKKLLFFATGSDRVPVGGLGKLHFVIAKNGGDSDRLPTSHTCFNVLLLPEYSTKEKLVLRLTTAIHNAEGFGMI